MSLPRAVIKGRAYMVTRRCSERRFFLRPDAETTNAFVYCLAIAAHRYNVGVMFTAAMSNHHHTGVIDRDGRLPEFLAYFHKLLAKHQNALRGRWENCWASEQTSAVELVTTDDAIDKMVYAISNPVKDQIVEKAHHWPGVDCLAAIRKKVPLRASKPTRFFRQDNHDLPDATTLEFVRPPGAEHFDHERWVTMLDERIAAVEVQAAKVRAQSGRRVLGRRAVRKQHWSARPDSHEPRRQLSPRVACRDKWRRLETIRRNRAFIDGYRSARDAFVAGDFSARFPAGTWWLVKFAGGTCAECDASQKPSS
jgi:REP element-mobilizing transposase RayT